MLSLLAATSFIAIFVGLNLWATQLIIRDPVAFPAQKTGHLLLTWCLPLMGALLVMHMQRKELDKSTGQYGEESDPLETMEALHEGLTSQDAGNP